MTRNPRGSSPWVHRARARVALALLAALASSGLASPATAASSDATAIAAQLEQKYDAGVTRDLARAQARYREAIAAIAAGRADEAGRLLEASSALDPDFPDPHFTLARVLWLKSPGRAVAEIAEAARILGRSYPWERHAVANTLTAILAIGFLSLFFAVVGIALRHLPHLTHVLKELMSPTPGRVTAICAAVVALAPLLWGLGIVPTATMYAGLLSFRLGRREAVLVALFLAAALALAGGARVVAPWAGGLTLEEPSLLVNRALESGSDTDLAAALRSRETADPTEPLYCFALGTMARRSGDLDVAERELTRAAFLRPREAWVLTNLGNVSFAREDYQRARDAYARAAALAPAAVEPHYNLAQVYTKQLMFTEASREQSIASSLAFDRVRDFSRITAPQLNRTVMDAAPPERALWELARRTAADRGEPALAENPALQMLVRLTPPAPFALAFLPALFLIFAGMGQLLGRPLATLHCSNCQRIVCRRCVRRMQQRAFCDDCFQSVKDLKSMEFTRLLLTRRDRSAARRRTIWESVLTFALPGAGQIVRGASLSGFAAIAVLVAAALLLVSNGALVPSLDVLPYGTAGWAKRIPLAILFALTYALTVARYYATTTTQTPRFAADGERASSRSREPRSRAEGGRR